MKGSLFSATIQKTKTPLGLLGLGGGMCSTDYSSSNRCINMYTSPNKYNDNL